MAVDNTTKTISEKLLIIFSIFIIGTVSAIISLKVNNKVHNSSYIQEGKIEKRETYTISFSESDAPDVNAWISSTPEDRSKGLSVVNTLTDDQAMLFVFDQVGEYPFWMKDMQFSIDIMWLDEDKKIVHMQPSAHPNDYPQSYYPQSNSLYVLEVVDGFTQKYNIQVGQVLNW